MNFDREHLATLAAVLRQGSFDGAAAELGVTQPAVSQRIRALEERVGLPLVLRGTPCRPTDAGKRLARHAEEIALQERAVLDMLGRPSTDALARVTLAVNADSLATWFPRVLGGSHGLLLDIQVDDQTYSADWLARGEVAAAVTGTARAARGCDTVALGSLRYVATASPGYMHKHFPHGLTPEALARAPMIAFSPKDELQHRWLLAQSGRKLAPPCQYLPSTHGFLDAARHGAGWCVNPLSLVSDDLARGSLVALNADLPLDVAHFWQVSRRMKPALQQLTKAVVSAASADLLPPS